MKLTERLKVEHGVYLLQLRHVEELLAAEAAPQALAAALSTIVVAEDHHSRLEDAVLYPELERRIGADASPLVEMRQAHERLRVLATQARLSASPGDVRAFVNELREHMEHEIHHVFPLIDELVSEERLSSLGNWQEDHVCHELGRPERWARS